MGDTILITPEQFDINKFKINDKLTKSKKGATLSQVSYDGKRLQIKVPKMYMPFPPNNKYDTLALTLSFGKQEHRNKEIQAFYNMCKQIDEYTLKRGVKNQEVWLGEQGMTEASLSKKLYPMIKPYMYAPNKDTPKIKIVDPNEKYPPCIKFKIDKFSEVFNYEKETGSTPMSFTDIPPGSQVSAIVECGGAWFPEQKISLSWKVKVSKVYQKHKVNVSDLSSDEEKEEVKTMNETTQVNPPVENEQVEEEEDLLPSGEEEEKEETIVVEVKPKPRAKAKKN